MTPSLGTRVVVWCLRLRGRAFVLGAELRLARAERLQRAGRRREAGRVVAVVRRDLRRERSRLART